MKCDAVLSCEREARYEVHLKADGPGRCAMLVDMCKIHAFACDDEDRLVSARRLTPEYLAVRLAARKASFKEPRTYRAAQRELSVARALCIDCRGPAPEDGQKRCVSCREKHNAIQRAATERARARRANGV